MKSGLGIIDNWWNVAAYSCGMWEYIPSGTLHAGIPDSYSSVASISEVSVSGNSSMLRIRRIGRVAVAGATSAGALDGHDTSDDEK